MNCRLSKSIKRFKYNEGVKYILVINKFKLKKKSLIQFYSPNNKILIGVDACVVIVQFGRRGVVPKAARTWAFSHFA